ncbi:MAG: type II toxin-antitoxin system antitoxin DNA ADP-ribosyl glycohydrolase DarG [Dehalococcoidia bacterium]
MITISRGNFWDADVDAIVNTVNCVGVMGKGIALQCKKAFPDNYDAYLKACKKGDVKPGRLFVHETKQVFGAKYIINFPTKLHWKGPSRYDYLESGLRALKSEVRDRKIRSIAIPPLGCGLGGLDWAKVRPMIEDALKEFPDVQAYVYEPVGTPAADKMPVAAREPRMTVARALLIKLMQQYGHNAYRLTLLEIQKLAYFLQEYGEGLQLNYVRHIYGPYANNLNKVLEVMEGHYISGYGDTQKPDVEIELRPGAIQKADAFLQDHPAAKQRLEKVADLVEGFETPYGMELLASVHWIMAHDKTAANSDEAILQVHQWTDRKRRLFKPEHIRIAWNRLHSTEWLASSNTCS